MIDKLKEWIKLLNTDGENTKETVLCDMIKTLKEMEWLNDWTTCTSVNINWTKTLKKMYPRYWADWFQRLQEQRDI